MAVVSLSWKWVVDLGRLSLIQPMPFGDFQTWGVSVALKRGHLKIPERTWTCKTRVALRDWACGLLVNQS